MTEIAEKRKNNSDPELEKILNQMGRELLLLEASDWQFLISTWSARDYAENRVTVHNENFLKLAELAEKVSEGKTLSDEEKEYLNILMDVDSLFKDIDFRNWAKL